MEALDPVAQRWREALLEALQSLGATEGAALLLSGGMDSTALLAGLSALGARPFCLAYSLAPTESVDARAARAAAARAGAQIQVLMLDRSPDLHRAYARDVLADLTRPAKKTHVQCAIPLAAMLDVLAAGPYRRVILGTGGIVEDNRKTAVLLAREGEGAARALRRRNLLGGSDSATEAMRRIAARRGFEYIEPYSAPPIAEYGLSLDVAEINRPRQKGIALRAFPEFFRGAPLWRPNTSLQVASGLRAYHDALAKSGGHSSTIAMLRSWLEEEGEDDDGDE